jgi:undecaprenyl-diphosphatase
MFYFGSFLVVIAALLLATAFGRRWRWPGRMPPRGHLGLHLALGVLILFGASWLFGGMAKDVVTGDPLTALDRNIVQWFNDHRTHGLTAVFLVATAFAAPLWVACATLATGLVLWRKRFRYRLLALVLAVPGGVAQIPLLKTAFHRRRPSVEDAYSIFHGYSFPSGHAMTATLLYGLLAILAVLSLKGWRRTWAVLAACAMVLLVGFSRVYLGAHYLSDVLGAIAAGIAWLALSLAAVDALRQSRSPPIQRMETP